MVGDVAWFASLIDADLTAASLTRDAVGAGCAQARALGMHGVVVHPTHVQLAPDDVVTTAVVGFPHGKHETLVKAAEARLAVQMGAEVVWLALDATITDNNALVAEIIAVRQAVPDPVELAVLATSTPIRSAIAEVPGVLTCADYPDQADLVRGVSSVDEAIAAVDAGAQRVALRNAPEVMQELS